MFALACALSAVLWIIIYGITGYGLIAASLCVLIAIWSHTNATICLIADHLAKRHK